MTSVRGCGVFEEGMEWGWAPKNTKLINKKKNKSKKQYYLITLLKYYVLQRSKIVYYAARGRNWTFHERKTRIPYTSHDRKSNFDRLLHIIFFITQRYIKSPFCVCKRGGIGGKALEKKNFGKE